MNSSPSTERDIRFVGVDLGWKADPPREEGTAVCVMHPGGRVDGIQLVTDDESILSLLEGDRVWSGIDAPLIVNNEEGLRGCERALFDRGIRVLPTSRGYLTRRYGSCRGVDLARELTCRGHSFPGAGEDRVMFEVYPYGALQILTGRRMPRYKRGPAQERREGALWILSMIRQWLPVTIPSWLDREVEVTSPKGLRSTMDKLDAVISVLCVYCHWLYSGERTEVLGDTEDGFVLLPR